MRAVIVVCGIKTPLVSEINPLRLLLGDLRRAHIGIVIEAERTVFGRSEKRTGASGVLARHEYLDHAKSVDCQPVCVSQRLAAQFARNACRFEEGPNLLRLHLATRLEDAPTVMHAHRCTSLRMQQMSSSFTAVGFNLGDACAFFDSQSSFRFAAVTGSVEWHSSDVVGGSPPANTRYSRLFSNGRSAPTRTSWIRSPFHHWRTRNVAIWTIWWSPCAPVDSVDITVPRKTISLRAKSSSGLSKMMHCPRASAGNQANATSAKETTSARM